jgi:hypothetical protein
MADLLINNPNWQSFASALEADRGLTPGMLSAVLSNETAGGHPDIIGRTSSAGAQGAYQFMPDTAKQYNVNVHDSADSTRGAADYLGDLSKKYNDPLLAGAAYNWGPGNVNKAMAAAANAGLPTDALSLANHGFLPKETAAYVTKLASNLNSTSTNAVEPFSPDVVAQTQNAVVGMVQGGASSQAIVQSLAKSPVASMIQHLSSNGMTAEDIVQQVGGTPLAKIRAAQQQVESQGFGTNLMQGADNAVSDLANGARQIGNRITGDDAALKANQAQQAALDADPTRQALDQTVGGMIGSGGVKALPYIAGTAIAPEGMIPAMLANGAMGAASGALKPTTGDGQFGHNIFTEAGLGAGGAALGYGVGKGMTALASKTLGGDAAATARLAEAKAQGLPANVASVSGPNGFWRNVAESMPENGSVISAQARGDQAVATKVAEGLGLKDYAGPIDTNMLNSARPAIKQALDDATNVSVTLPQSLKADLQGLVKSGTNPLTDGISNNSTVNAAIGNLNKAIDAGTPVAGTDLQGLASELKSLLYNPGTSHSEKQLASNVIDKINGSLTSNMTPQQANAFNIANGQYRNLLAVQKMVKASNDTGTVTPRQMLQAAKTGSFSNSFLKGDAPFQDLAGTASELYGPSAGKGLGAIIGKATGGHGLDMAALIMHPSPITAVGVGAKSLAANLLAKAATSENPTMIRLLTGAGGKPMNPALASAITRALGGIGAAGTGSFGP